MSARYRFVVLPALAFAASALAGCVSDDVAGRVAADPGRYVNYSCPQLVRAASVLLTRQRELEISMAKAGTGTGGSLVTATAYRPEYVANKGELNVIQRQAAERQCDMSKAAVIPEPPPKPVPGYRAPPRPPATPAPAR